MFAEDKNKTEKDVENDMDLTLEPWMKYVVKLERVFRSFGQVYKRKSYLMSTLDRILSLAEDSSDELSKVDKLALGLPKVENVKYPGRPKKTKRLSSLRKDYVKNGKAKKRIRLSVLRKKYIPKSSPGFDPTCLMFYY